MRKEQKDRMRKWIAALRSGDYKQANGALCNTEVRNGKEIHSYCCLGVLCDVSGLGSWQKEKSSLEEGMIEIEATYLGESGVLPARVAKWIGLDFNPTLVDAKSNFDSCIAATEANDDLEWSFKKIATALEKKYLPEDVVSKKKAPVSKKKVTRKKLRRK